MAQQDKPVKKPVTSPKSIQHKDPDKALRVFIARYSNILETEDRYMSEMYMDEILASAIKSREARAEGKTTRMRPNELSELVREALGPVAHKNPSVVNDDIEIALSKRYPSVYEIERKSGKRTKPDSTGSRNRSS